MEYLYKTTSQITYSEYKKFNIDVFIGRKNIMVWLILDALWLVLSIISRDIISMAAALLWPILLILVYYISIKKAYASNKIMQDIATTFEFFDTYLVEKSTVGESVVEYSQLHKIIETKTNFYLMIASNQGYILPKENFPDGLEEFLRNIIIEKKVKYKRR